jgi:hypothetical protein
MCTSRALPLPKFLHKMAKGISRPGQFREPHELPKLVELRFFWEG